jgi:RHS repeat-associated protein
VKFGTVTAPTTAWSATSITTTVPAAATTSPVTVTVGGLASNGLTFTIGANTAPVVSGPSGAFSFLGSASSVPIVATDPDNQLLTYSATGLPPGIAVNSSTGVMSGTAPSTAGAFTVTASVSDGIASRSRTFVWTVGATNGTPTITAPTHQSHQAGAAVSVYVVATDPENQTLSYAALGLPPGLSINAATGLITGTISLAAAGGYPVTLSVSDGMATTTRLITWAVTPTGSQVFDSFTELTTNVPLDVHVPDVAPGFWTRLMGTAWPLVTTAGIGGLTGTGYQVNVIESNVSDGIVSTKFTSTSASGRFAGLVLRAQDADRFLLLLFHGDTYHGTLTLLKRVNATFVTVASVRTSPVAPSSTHTLEARLSGTSITALFDGLSMMRVSVPDFQTASAHGVLWHLSTDATVRFDDFAVTTQTYGDTLPLNTVCNPTSGPASHLSLPGDSTQTLQTAVGMPAPGCGWKIDRLLGSFATIADSGGAASASHVGTQNAQIHVQNSGSSPEEYQARMAYFVVAGELVSIAQSSWVGQFCGYAGPPSSIVLGLGGGTVSYTVSPDPGGVNCTYIPWTNSDWLTVSPASAVSGSQTLQLSAGRGPDAGRTAVVRLGSRSLSIQQDADACTLSMSDTSVWTVPAAGGPQAPRAVTVGATCGWEAFATPAGDVLVEPLIGGNPSANPTGSGQVRITLPNNTWLEPRYYTLTVQRPGTGYSVTIPIVHEGLGGGSGGAGPAGPVEYFHSDAVGTVRMVTSETGTLLASYDFFPFGQQSGGTGSSDNKRLFTGQERDTELTVGSNWGPLDYFGARYYDARAGRFTGVDPVLTMGDNLVDPQRWNRYVYVRNNPLKYTDPTGAYLVDCASADKACLADADEFEKARQRDLQSRHRHVRDAAASYGDRGRDNGVRVGFAQLPQGTNGRATIGLTDDLRFEIQVTIRSGRRGSGLDQTVAHEGTHAEDFQSFLDSSSVFSPGFDHALLPSNYAAEFRAFSVGALVAPYKGIGKSAASVDRHIRSNYPPRTLHDPSVPPIWFPKK